MARLAEYVPMKILFVLIIGLLPIVLTVRKVGLSNITVKEWLAFAIFFGGTLSTWIATAQYGQSHFLIWPLLGVMAIGLTLYRAILRIRGEFDDEEVSRGATSFE